MVGSYEAASLRTLPERGREADGSGGSAKFLRWGIIEPEADPPNVLRTRGQNMRTAWILDGDHAERFAESRKTFLGEFL